MVISVTDLSLSAWTKMGSLIKKRRLDSSELLTHCLAQQLPSCVLRKANILQVL